VSRDDSFDRFYKVTNRFFSSSQFHTGVTTALGLFALIVTLGAILQPMPVLTRVTLIVMAVVSWLFTLTWFNWRQKWKIVSAWKREREELQCKIERANIYFEKVDAGELPAELIPPEIRQDLRDILAAWRRELLRQEGL
jgi:hypothetical protein